jgi:Cu(I)/Ag(I) efflux system membrane fusion protein
VATVHVDDPDDRLTVGLTAFAALRVAVAQTEPFRSMPREPPQIRKGEPRTLYVCAEHTSVQKEAPGRCPKDRSALMPLRLADNQRVGWWCPMHPEIVADVSGSSCSKCEGMKLVPRVVTFSPRDQVLAVPEPAVVDTGRRAVVFVEQMPGTFDAVELAVGPRCGGYYPVISGLAQGDRVAVAGAFLIDAETRLNPGLAAGYFGAGRDR